LAKDVNIEMPNPDFKGTLNDLIHAIENLSAQ
jgi:hypothetical protein